VGVIENMKDVADLVKKAGDIDLYRKIVSLEGEVLDLTREKRRLEARVEELEKSLEFKGQLKFDKPFFWMDGDNTPYCPSCWEVKGIAVHLFQYYKNQEETRWDCTNCKQMFLIPSRQESSSAFFSGPGE
jgi:hypothetical protein